MAFSSKLISRYEMFPGLILEKWQYTGAGVTTGTITPDIVDEAGIGKIAQVDLACVSDDSNPVRFAYPVGYPTVVLTFTSGDTGTCTIIGKAR